MFCIDLRFLKTVAAVVHIWGMDRQTDGQTNTLSDPVQLHADWRIKY